MLLQILLKIHLDYKYNKYMNKKLLFLILLLVVLITPLMVAAQTAGIEAMVNRVQAIAISVGTPIITIGWVIAGILWLTSAGSPEKTGIAKKAIVACVIGTMLIVLAAISQTITSLIQDTFSI